MASIVISHFQVAPLLQDRSQGVTTAITSIDLNRSTCQAALSADGVRYPSGEQLSWQDAETIARNSNKCYRLTDNAIIEISGYSETTGWPRSLFPTQSAPTMLVSGIAMHRIKDIDPFEDTKRKIHALGSIGGRVLDTATGLGYTAILSAKSAEKVVTVELDPLSIEIARDNPWSQELFSNVNIVQISGDVFDAIEDMESDQFSSVIHDPPMFSLAGELYSRDFYYEVYRVLKARGRMFHYIGDLSSRSGRGVLKGVIRRLDDVGFTRIKQHPDAFGIVAFK